MTGHSVCVGNVLVHPRHVSVIVEKKLEEEKIELKKKKKIVPEARDTYY
jgi:hypothetical protein